VTAAVAAGLVFVTLVAARHARSAGRQHRAVDRLTAPGRWLSSAWLPPAPAALEAALASAAVATDPRVVASGWVTAAAVVPAVALLTAGPGLAVVTGVAATVGPLVALRLAGGRMSAQIERAMPLALETMARTLRTGGSMRHAVAEAASAVDGPLGADLAGAVAHADRGAPLVAALDEWAAQRALPGVRLAAAAIALGAETGGAQARALDGVAATLRERLAAAAEMRAQAAQAKVSGAVIALAPIAFCFLASATDPRTGRFLFRTPGGLVLLTAGLGLDAAGALWMARLTRATA
jgi:tight adherence protein B